MDDNDDELHEANWWRYLLAGGVAGTVSRTCTAPLDRLKIFLQVNDCRRKMAVCFLRLIDEGGVTGLWRGNFANILRIAPDTAIKFSVFKRLKHLLNDYDISVFPFFDSFVAGAVAGGLSQSVVYPIDFMKTRLLLRTTGQYSGMLDAVAKIHAREGFRAFYRGYGVNMLGIVPYAGIEISMYETMKYNYLPPDGSKETKLWILLLSGSTSSALGQLYYYPFNLIRTRLQVEVNYPPSTVKSVVKHIIKRNGFFGLYRGFIPNIIKIVPAVSISYTVYEYASRILGVTLM